MDKKNVQRDVYLRIRMTKNEKKQFENYSKEMGLKTSTLARKILLGKCL